MSGTDQDQYFIMTTTNPKGMLLYNLPEPESMTDGWLFGQKFHNTPTDLPLRVEIREGFENAELTPFFDTCPLVCNDLYDALLEIGVDNIVAYDAVIHSEDDTVVHGGYKAINVIGLVKAAGPGTVYVGDSRLINASIDELDFEPQSVNGLLLFRMAENVADIVVSEKVKSHIERKNFHSIEFIPVRDYFTL